MIPLMFYHHHLLFVICICTSASNTNFTPSWYQVRALFSQFRLLLLIIPMKKKKQQKTQMKMETRAAVIYGYLFLVVLLFAANNRGNFLQKKKHTHNSITKSRILFIYKVDIVSLLIKWLVYWVILKTHIYVKYHVTCALMNFCGNEPTYICQVEFPRN